MPETYHQSVPISPPALSSSGLMVRRPSPSIDQRQVPNSPHCPVSAAACAASGESAARGCASSAAGASAGCVSSAPGAAASCCSAGWAAPALPSAAACWAKAATGICWKTIA